jgi:hypothetical protein
MQHHPNSQMSNNYLPKLVHYISGRNDTILHRLMGDDLKNITFRDDMQDD